MENPYEYVTVIGTAELEESEEANRHIDKLGYRGWIGCEYKPAKTTAAGLGWAQPWLQREGATA